MLFVRLLPSVGTREKEAFLPFRSEPSYLSSVLLAALLVPTLAFAVGSRDRGVLRAPPEVDETVEVGSPLTASGGVVRGDVDGDGAVSVVDALAILTSVIGKTLPVGWSADPQGDVDCDGSVTTLDAAIVLASVVGKDVSGFCVGQPLVGSLTVVPDSVFVFVSDTVRFQANLNDVQGNPLSSLVPRWRSGDIQIATVDSTGLVTGTGTGATFVHAELGGVQDSAKVVSAAVRLGTQTLRIVLPSGVSAQEIAALSPYDSTPVVDLNNTAVNLDSRLITLLGVGDSLGNTLLLTSAMYPAQGAVLTADVLSTATSLVMAHPWVAPLLHFGAAEDKAYQARIAARAETRVLADLLAAKLPTVPGILGNMDAAVQNAVNDAAMGFLSTITTLPTRPGAAPAGVARLEPDTTQSGIELNSERFSVSDSAFLRLKFTNHRRRYLEAVVQDTSGQQYGTPKDFFIPPAPDLLSVSVFFGPSRQESSINLASFNRDTWAGGEVRVKVYGPGLFGLTTLTGDEWGLVVKPTLVTAGSQFLAPVLGAALGVPVSCALSMANGLTSSLLGDSGLTTSVETKLKNGDNLSAILTTVGVYLSKLTNPLTLADLVVQCGFSVGTAAVMATKLGAYAIPVLGQVKVAADVLSVGITAVPTAWDIAHSNLRDTWTLTNRVHLAVDLSTDGLNAMFVPRCTDDAGTTVSCGRIVYAYGDGVVDTLAADSVSHAYSGSGQYSAAVAVRDDDAATADTTMDVFVAKPVRGAVVFLGCEGTVVGCSPRQLFFYDLLADTVHQLTAWTSNDDAGAGVNGLTLTISRDGAHVAWNGVSASGGLSEWVMFVPGGSASMFELAATNTRIDCLSGGSGACFDGPYSFGHDGVLYNGGARINGINPHTGYHEGHWVIAAVSPTRGATPSVVVDYEREAQQSGATVCLPNTWSFPFYDDSNYLTMRSAEPDTSGVGFGAAFVGPCEFNRDTRSGTLKFQSTYTRQGWLRAYRTKAGGYVASQSAIAPFLWNVSGTTEQRVNSLSRFYFGMAYNWDEDLIVIAEGADGITVVNASDLSDKQRRLSGYRVDDVATSPYPSGG